jgi:uncharacterized coiled-coil protein SlyX
LDNRIKQLELAHTAQQELVMELQQQVASSRKYRDIILKQELIIKELQIASSNSAIKSIPSLNSVASSNSAITSPNPKASSINLDKSSSQSADQFDNINEYRLLLRATKAETRVKALEEQLIEKVSQKPK